MQKNGRTDERFTPPRHFERRRTSTEVEKSRCENSALVNFRERMFHMKQF